MLSLLRKKESLLPDIRHFKSPETHKNEYLIINDREAAVIDVDSAVSQVCNIIETEQLRLKYILASHGHPSHIRAVPELKEQFDAAFCLHASDSEWLKEAGVSIEPDLYLKEGLKLHLGKLEIRVLHTPGHSVGSVCFWIKSAKLIFTGSTLKKRGYGKIWGGNSMALMVFSLKRLNYAIPSETVVYPRVGDVTSMGKEGWMNFLRSY